MKEKLVTISALACLVSVVLAGPVIAQGALQPGTEFPAAPMSKGGLSLSAPTQTLPPPGPPEPAVAPTPEPTPKKRHRRRR